MLLLILPAVTIALMILGSVIACKKTPKDAHFPMQIGMDGKVNYRASKLVAASVFPAIAVITLGILTLTFMAVEGAGASSIFVVGIVGFNCILLLAIHIGFMYFGVRNVNEK